MFHVNNAQQLRQIANSIGQGSHSFSEEDEVWRGDNGSFVIGDTTSEFDEDEAEMYVLAGTLGEYATQVQ